MDPESGHQEMERLVSEEDPPETFTSLYTSVNMIFLNVMIMIFTVKCRYHSPLQHWEENWKCLH